MDTKPSIDEVVLQHYGVKGMQWGVRKDKTPRAVILKQQPGKFVKTSGGQNLPAHPDAVRVADLRQKAKKSTPDALSNDELRALVDRMGLEDRYDSLAKTSSQRRASFGKKTVQNLLGDPQNKEMAVAQIGKGAVKGAAMLGGGRAAVIGVQVGAFLARGAVHALSGGNKGGSNQPKKKK